MQHKGLRNTLSIHVHYVEMLLISTILYYSERTNRFNMNSIKVYKEMITFVEIICT
jgi:hypothetical protein